MAEILVQKAKCDLLYKSKEGSDALHLACKLGNDFIYIHLYYI